MALELEEADLEAILAPIPGEKPTGIDVREDFTPTSVYFRLRDARSDARDAERQADGAERVDQGPGNRDLADRGAGPHLRPGGPGGGGYGDRRAGRALLGRRVPDARRCWDGIPALRRRRAV